jgi:diguanylate cyclase (GGDEF)-like protein
MADVDHFKSINDKYGHGFGDEVLRKIAAVLGEQCRPKDIVCRYGGEEFAILLPHTGPVDAVEVAERLRVAVESMIFAYCDQPVAVTCSFGVAYLRDQVPPTILELADEALYTAKHTGRNRVTRWEDPAIVPEACAF